MSDHVGTVLRSRTPRWAPGLAWRLRLGPVYRWLIAGRTGRCSCGWHTRAASSSAADSALAAHVYGKYAPRVAAMNRRNSD